MTTMYAMQRANGDWFAMSEAGRLFVPAFTRNSDARQARSLNSEMLHFKPMQLDECAIRDLRPAKSEVAARFRLISDQSLDLSRGRLIDHAQLTLLAQNGHVEAQTGV